MNNEELEKKWLKNELSESERTLFNQLDDAEFNNEIIENAQHFKAANIIEIDSFETFNNKYFSKRTFKKRLSVCMKVAAILVVGLGLYFIDFNNEITEIKTLVVEKQTVKLPDQSTVTLNAESEIHYNKKNWNNERTIKLDGEAYFKITKGSTFTVNTNQGIVTVVGTQFNVKDRNAYFEVECFEGIVKVTSDTITRMLHAGDTYRYIDGKFFERKTQLTSPQWTHNMSVFEAVPLKAVFSELERQYNIQVKYSTDNNRLFTGVFVHDDLKNALLAITKPMNLTYEMNSSNLIEIHEKKD